MATERRRWTYEESLVVFRLYCRTPFGRLHQRNPEIVDLAERIDRTPGAVAMKAVNFASLDPELQARKISGLGNASAADRELWEAFFRDSERVAEDAEAAYEALLQQGAGEPLRDSARPVPEGVDSSVAAPDTGVFTPGPAGESERFGVAKVRRVQSFFRAAVLTSYGNQCALTGLAIPELLNASHIVPWYVEEKRRADPRNGLCLNALHDRAFDRGFIAFDADHRVIVSPHIDAAAPCTLQRTQLAEIAGRLLCMPHRFQPDPEALAFHRDHIYRA